MEFLKSVEQIDKEINKDESLIQGLLFPELKNIDNDIISSRLCPICMEREIYWDWWTCKWCGKHTPIKEYTSKLIEHFSYDS